MVAAPGQRGQPGARPAGPANARPQYPRLFIALWPDAETRTALALAVVPFASKGRGMAPPNLHMTLAFLGATPARAVPRLLRLMREAGPVVCSLHLDHYGVFAAPRILWLGSRQPDPALLRYHERLTALLDQAGFPTEQRSFKPHVTLVRDFVRDADVALPAISIRWRAAQFALVESVSTPGGVRYRVIGNVTP